MWLLRARYILPNVFLSFLPVMTCELRWWSCFDSVLSKLNQYLSWYATFNWPTLISDRREHPLALKWKVFNSALIASKMPRSAFLQDQTNFWQATQTHKQRPNNPACTYDWWGCVAYSFKYRLTEKWLVELYVVWLWYPKCWKAFEEMFICF